MMSALKRIFPLLIMMTLALFVLTWSGLAHAGNINSVRVFSNSANTRVVFDLDFDPIYDKFLNYNGSTFIVSIYDVDNYANAQEVHREISGNLT